MESAFVPIRQTIIRIRPMWIAAGRCNRINSTRWPNKALPLPATVPIHEWSMQIRSSSAAPNPVALQWIIALSMAASDDFRRRPTGRRARDPQGLGRRVFADERERAAQGNWIREIIERRGSQTLLPRGSPLFPALQINIYETQLSNPLEASCEKDERSAALNNFIYILLTEAQFVRLKYVFLAPPSEPNSFCAEDALLSICRQP